MALLNIDNLTMRFGGLYAVHNVSAYVDKGEIVGIIGPNGAGKTTLFNMFSGLYTPTEGTITFRGHTLNRLKPHKIANLGITRTFQNILLFNKMTVLDNILVGMHGKTTGNCLDAIFHTKRQGENEQKATQEALNLLEMVGMSEYRYDLAGSLPYGMQRKLEIVRAMASNTELLLFDEPAAGMNEQETAELSEFVKSVRAMGYTIILIEHDMKFVMSLCDRIYVLNYGELISKGTTEEVKNDPVVIEAYLGKGRA